MTKIVSSLECLSRNCCEHMYPVLKLIRHYVLKMLVPYIYGLSPFTKNEYNLTPQDLFKATGGNAGNFFLFKQYLKF